MTEKKGAHELLTGDAKNESNKTINILLNLSIPHKKSEPRTERERIAEEFGKCFEQDMAACILAVFIAGMTYDTGFLKKFLPSARNIPLKEKIKRHMELKHRLSQLVQQLKYYASEDCAATSVYDGLFNLSVYMDDVLLGPEDEEDEEDWP